MLLQNINSDLVAVDVDVVTNVEVPYANLKRGVPVKKPSGTVNPD
jgi:hypothetical protein